MKGAEAKAELQHHRQQEWHGADGDTEQETAENTGPKGHNAQQLQIDHWIGMAPGVPDKQRQREESAA